MVVDDNDNSGDNGSFQFWWGRSVLLFHPYHSNIIFFSLVARMQRDIFVDGCGNDLW